MPGKLKDIELIDHIKKDDELCFKELIARYYVQLCEFVKIILIDKEATEELVEDVFIIIWNKRSEIEIKSSVKAYLFTSAKNHAFNSNKSCAVKHLKMHQEVVDNMQEIENPETFLIQAELVQSFETAVSLLPNQTRKVFELKYYSQARQKEIAKELNISENTVEKHVSRALRHLRKALLGVLVLTVFPF